MRLLCARGFYGENLLEALMLKAPIFETFMLEVNLLEAIILKGTVPEAFMLGVV